MKKMKWELGFWKFLLFCPRIAARCFAMFDNVPDGCVALIRRITVVHAVFPFKRTVQQWALPGQCCIACCAVVAYVISACSIKHSRADALYLPWWAAYCIADADQHHAVFPFKCTVQQWALLGQCCIACCAVVAYVISACSFKHNRADALYLPWWAAYCIADADQHHAVFPFKCTVQQWAMGINVMLVCVCVFSQHSLDACIVVASRSGLAQLLVASSGR